MNSIRLYIDLLSEAAYDNMVASMKLKFPDAAQAIDQFVKWCKAALVKSDRITWMLRIYSAELSGNQQLLKSLLGTFEGTTQDVATQITHYFGFNVPAITNYQFLKQPVSQVIDDFEQLKDSHESKVNREKPVTPEQTDKVLFEFSNGTKWWFVDRGYCPEEGRSGNHCGNVMGKHEPTQRILSYRSPEGHVILTFILLENGTLGEMKAKGNQKPSAKYHPYIMPLLLWDRVTGIAPTDRQYAPDLNFNVFDLNDQYLKEIDAKKPNLITTQIKSRPTEILKSPVWIKEKYRKFVKSNFPAIDPLLFSTDNKDWETAISKDKSLVVYAPNTLKNFKQRVSKEFVRDMYLMIQAPKPVRTDPEILVQTIRARPRLIELVHETTNGYLDLCKLAVQQRGDSIVYIPEKNRTPEVCDLAVQQTGHALKFVPENYRTPEMCKNAVSTFGKSIEHVPMHLRTPEIYKLAVRQDGYVFSTVPKDIINLEMCKDAVKSNGFVLKNIPVNFKTPEVCKIAVRQHGASLAYVPEHLRTFELCALAVRKEWGAIRHVPEAINTKELCRLAIRADGVALKFIPNRLKTPELCALAIRGSKEALPYVPEDILTPEMCKLAIRADGGAIKHVPEGIMTTEMCKLAVRHRWDALYYVPEKFQTPDVCSIAVRQDGIALQYVSNNLRTLKLCELAVQNNFKALKFVPPDLRTLKICKIAVQQNEKSLRLVPASIRAKLEKDIK